MQWEKSNVPKVVMYVQRCCLSHEIKAIAFLTLLMSSPSCACTYSSRDFAGRSFARSPRKPQVSVTQKLDSAIHRINRYPMDTYLGNQLRYPLDRDLFNGWRYPPLEKLGPSCVGYIIRIWRIWLLRPFFKVLAAAVLNSIDRIKFDLYYLDGFWEMERSSWKCIVHVHCKRT